MLAWLLCVVCGRVMALVLLCCRWCEYKELEIVVLRHEVGVLRQPGALPGGVDRLGRLFL